jgi:protein-arginine kinase activator protein McsA
MKWITYKNINEIEFTDNELCNNCRNSEFNQLIRRGTLIDPELGFLTYITIIANNPNEEIIGSHPNHGSEIMNCQGCGTNFLKYYMESGFAGVYKYKRIYSNSIFNAGIASCLLTINQLEKNFLRDNYRIESFTKIRSTTKFKFNFKAEEITKLKAVNFRLNPKNDMISFNLLGKRIELHNVINSLEKTGLRGKQNKYIILNKKLKGEIEKVSFENGIQIEDEIHKNIRNEISESIRGLANEGYSNLGRKKDYMYQLLKLEGYEELRGTEVPKLIEKIKSIS